LSERPHPGCRIHPTALIEQDVSLGEGTAVWDGAHIRRGARIGRGCIIGEKTYVAYEVSIGDYCKLNASVYVCAGVSIEDHVMLSAHVVFTNDRFPRAFDRQLGGLATSEPTEETLETRVGRGVTVGAGAIVGPGLTLGAFSMVGMGSVVTRDVPPHALVIGTPARVVAYVCVCGPPVVRIGERPGSGQAHCDRCGRDYRVHGSGIEETS
jgi:acetyltransferase-like isoleucine patch superfamily enzyme